MIDPNDETAGKNVQNLNKAAGAMTLHFLTKTAAAMACSLFLTGAVLAQDLFAPRLYVNDRVVTEYEVMQRAMFLQILRAPGDPEEEALKALIDDRLRQIEADRLDLTVTEEETMAGMEEFASRANLSAEALIGELAKVGISGETFRDFVQAGLVWRQVVRARFAGQVSVSENEIDQALAATARQQALRVLVSELVIPTDEANQATTLDLARSLSSSISSEGAFTAAAQRYSKSPTASRGGRLDWMPLANLPAAIGGAILALGPGEVSDPIVVPGAVVLFQLREVAVDTSAPPIAVTVEWAEFLVPDDATEIARIRAAVDVCYDLNAQARGLGADRLTQTTAPASEVPTEVGLELVRLDPGESSVALTRGEFRRLIMLCSRQATQDEPVNRDTIREQLLNRKLEALSEGYLEELRAAALIHQP